MRTMRTIVRIAGLLAALACGRAVAVPDAVAWEFWRGTGPVEVVDHTTWQTFLDRYLVAGGDGIHRVRYHAVSAAARKDLEGYLQALADRDPRTLARPAQMAYWINLYNALTVNVVLDYPRKRSILRMGRRLLAIGPWDDQLIEVAGQRLTLNDMEHRILRPLFGDERVHFAVNCASLSCPNLASQAYTGENLEDLLESQVHDYLHHPRGLRQTGAGFEVSSIFEWYRADFAADEAGLRLWLAKRRPDLAAGLLDPARRLSHDYDWNLNISE